MERRLFVHARGGAQVEEIRFFRTGDSQVFALYVNGVATGIDVHIRDMNVSGSGDYFPLGANVLELHINAKACRLPEISTGEETE